MDESRFVQVTPLEKQVESGLLRADLAAVPRETIHRAQSRSTEYLARPRYAANATFWGMWTE